MMTQPVIEDDTRQRRRQGKIEVSDERKVRNVDETDAFLRRLLSEQNF